MAAISKPIAACAGAAMAALAMHRDNNFLRSIDTRVKTIIGMTATFCHLEQLLPGGPYTRLFIDLAALSKDFSEGFLVYQMIIVPSGSILKQYAVQLYKSFQNRNITRVVTSNPKECRDIIIGKILTPRHSEKNTLGKYESRSIPNERLVNAFGVKNCFTTPDEKFCKEFRTSVEKRLYVPEEMWPSFAEAAKASISRELGTEQEELSLFAVVQTLTIEVMIKILMPNNIDKGSGLNPDALRRLAHEINVQWVRSKVAHDPSVEQDWSFCRQDKLQSALRAAFPDWKGNREDNPCNYLLPGYETMWRAVLRCFFELTVRDNPNAKDWSAALEEFLENPRRAQLENSERFQTPAIHIAKEVLRVYPPTRRVYRRFKTEGGMEYEAAADIEALHRDKQVWGDEATTFRPERWENVTEQFENDNWLPFGTKPFNCPAKRGKNVPIPFGVAMISLLTAALIRATKDGGWTCKVHIPKDVLLDTDREAYKDVVLRKGNTSF